MRLIPNKKSSGCDEPTTSTPEGPRRFAGRGRGGATGRSPQRRESSGVVTVELALTVPILLLLTFGLIEYGWMFLKSQELTNAVRRGTRVAVRADATTSDVVATIDEMMNAADLGGSGYQVTITPSDVSSAVSGDVVTVEISVPYENITLANTPIIPTPSTLQASTSMAKEGP